MIVRLGPDGALELVNPHDFRSFSYEADGIDRRDVAAVVFRNDHAWVSIEALHSYPPFADDARWQESMGQMINFAASRGWIDPSGERVCAHIKQIG